MRVNRLSPGDETYLARARSTRRCRRNRANTQPADTAVTARTSRQPKNLARPPRSIWVPIVARSSPPMRWTMAIVAGRIFVNASLNTA